MTEFAIPALYALLIWWLGTGIVLTVVRRRIETYRRSLIVGMTLAVAALVVIAASSRQDTDLAAYLGFTSAIAAYGVAQTSGVGTGSGSSTGTGQ